jgi:CubicO group peptidase (beta-lactamase class C family)
MRQLLLLIFLLASFTLQAQEKYFPKYLDWQMRIPSEFSISNDVVKNASRFAIENEAKVDRNQELSQRDSFGKEPFGFGVGAFSERGEPTGLIIHKGYIIGKWGNPDAVEMTHSVTKSFLSSSIGLAVEKGLIKSVDDLVYLYVPPIEIYGEPVQRLEEEVGTPELIDLFATPHNKTITWNHLLRQTSDWEGTLWGKPDWADRPSKDTLSWKTRPRNKPGAVFEYNDTRVNVLALAAQTIWRKPLPVVLKEEIMDRIGASSTWQWKGYRNSFVIQDGQIMQAVSGGGHWGGGMFINAYDMARFGLLTLNNGNWNGEQILPEAWIKQAKIPTEANKKYGYMNFFLNTDKEYLPDAPAEAFFHLGNGTNMVYCDPTHDLVIVARWLDSKAMNGLVKSVMAEFGK